MQKLTTVIPASTCESEARELSWVQGLPGLQSDSVSKETNKQMYCPILSTSVVLRRKPGPSTCRARLYLHADSNLPFTCAGIVKCPADRLLVIYSRFKSGSLPEVPVACPWLIVQSPCRVPQGHQAFHHPVLAAAWQWLPGSGTWGSGQYHESCAAELVECRPLTGSDEAGPWPASPYSWEQSVHQRENTLVIGWGY